MDLFEAKTILFNETPATHIIGHLDSPGYFEFYVKCGCDFCTYRVYKNSGRITEK